MASPAERRRNNVRAGVFVTITIVLAVAILVVVSGAWETVTRTSRRYTVSFPISAGVSNLQPGAEVRVGGVAMGRVRAVRPHIRDDEAFREIHVELELDRRIQLYSDARIYVTAALLGADAWLDVPDVGSSGVPAEDVLAGSTGQGLLGALLGPEGAVRTSEIVDNASEFTSFLADFDQEYETRVVPVLENMEAITSDTRAVVSDVRETRWPGWADTIDEVMTWATAFTEDLDEALATGHGLLGDGREILVENRESVRTTVGNLEVASTDAREILATTRSETVDKVHRLLDTAQESLDEAVAAVTTIRTDYEGWVSDLGETLGNAALASQQLKLTTTEVRRNPWRLLYRPESTELEHELLYDAARSFALAVSDLKAASRSAQNILDKHADRLHDDPELLDRVKQNLVDPLQRYEEAQARLFDVLIAEGP